MAFTAPGIKESARRASLRGHSGSTVSTRPRRSRPTGYTHGPNGDTRLARSARTNALAAGCDGDQGPLRREDPPAGSPGGQMRVDREACVTCWSVLWVKVDE